MPYPSLTQLEQLFDQAVALPPEARPSFLDAECRGAPHLRTAVEALLETDAELARDDDFLRGPVAVARSDNHDAALPIQIEGYRILRKIGDGGMGTVYEAEQDNPRRRVAIKAIRPGMNTRELAKRFALEAQVLGRLRHPGIAQIYQAGLTENGQPFIAMEYINGTTLVDFAQQTSLDVSARIELVARVCDAVQHAHSQGIIHRDLKPGNILVDDSGQPHVLDFGVARAADIELLTTAAHTQTGQLIGTLAYMSPEQIAADPAKIDQHADVYALGVVLFELLAERLPFDVQKLPLPEAARVICEQEAPAVGSVNRLLGRDITTIAAKALEKTPEKRYCSVQALAADLRRYQAGEPIQARPISGVERLWRWSRRRRSVAASLAVVTFLIIATAIGSTVAAFRYQEIAARNAKLASAAEAAREKKAWLAIMANQAKAYEFASQSGDESYRMAERPVLHHHESPTRGSDDIGAVWVWRDRNNRPVALGTIFGWTESPGKRGVIHEMCSLSRTRFQASWNYEGETAQWRPRELPEWKPLANAPVPSLRQEKLRAQLESQAQRFTAHGFRSNKRWRLWLISAPVYEYESPELDDTLGGAVFVMCQDDSNADVIIGIEAVREDKDKPYRFEYVLGSFTDMDLHVELDKREVWGERSTDSAVPSICIACVEPILSSYQV